MLLSLHPNRVPQANKLLGAWLQTSTDRRLFEEVSSRRFMKLPGLLPEGRWFRDRDCCRKANSEMSLAADNGRDFIKSAQWLT